MRQMLLHAEAFDNRCLYTQKHLPRDVWHIHAYTRRSFLTQMVFQTITEALTQRSLYTENLLHTEAFTHASFFTETFTQRSFYAQELLHTDAFTRRSLYARRLFTDRSFYTEKPLHTDAFPQKSRFHRAALTHFKKSQFYVSFGRSAIISCERVASGVGKSQFLTLDNNFVWKGCAWPCKIAILHKFYFARNGCAWRFKMDKVAILNQFLNVCIWR